MTDFGATPNWMQDLDALREQSVPHQIEMSDEQKQFLEYARQGPKPLSFNKIAMAWQKQGWGGVKPTWLQKRWAQMLLEKIDKMDADKAEGVE